METIQLLSVPADAGSNSDTSQIVDSRHGPEQILKAHEDLYGGFNVAQPFESAGVLACENEVDDLLISLHSKLLQLIGAGGPIAVLGGAHTLSLASARALRDMKAEYSLLYFDAHPDIMPNEDVNYGSTLFHAIEEGALDPSRLCYVGIRQIEREEEELITKHNILSFRPEDLAARPLSDIAAEINKQLPGPRYMSIDIDSIDPSFAPGVTTPCPGGLSPQQVLYLAKQFCSKDLLGFEIVEVAPAVDRHELTTRLAAHLLQEIGETLSEAWS